MYLIKLLGFKRQHGSEPPAWPWRVFFTFLCISTWLGMAQQMRKQK